MSAQDPKWISRYVDEEVPLPRRERIARVLEASEEARRLKADFESIGGLLREDPMPEARPAEAVWADVRRQIRLGRDKPESLPRVFGSRLQWAGAMMIAVLIGLAARTWIQSSGPSAQGPLVSPVAEVEWMETDVPGATTMLYQDEETGLTVIWMIEPSESEQGQANT